MEIENSFDTVYPSEEEMMAAQYLCCGKVCKKCETPAAYAWRKREVDLSILLEKAIEEELTEKEKNVIDGIWYKNLSLTDVSRKLGVSPSAVKSTSDRALEKLRNALRYVVYYQRDIFKESIVPAVVARALMISAARKYVPEDICPRIRNLRISRGYSLRAMKAATNIDIKRISTIEGGCIPSLEELVLLSGFFGVSVDYILKGEKDV